MRNAKTKRLRLQQGTYGSDICLRASHKLLLPAEISCRGACDMGYYSRLLRRTVLIIFSGGLFVKVVLFKSPKFLSGILRVLFGIKKQNG